MKFDDGYWLLRDGVIARYAAEALDVRAEAERCEERVCVKVRRDGDRLSAAVAHGLEQLADGWALRWVTGPREAGRGPAASELEPSLR